MEIIVTLQGNTPFQVDSSDQVLVWTE